jgi:hypothetical protein
MGKQIDNFLTEHVDRTYKLSAEGQAILPIIDEMNSSEFKVSPF